MTDTKEPEIKTYTKETEIKTDVKTDENMVLQKIDGVYRYCRSEHIQNQMLAEKLMKMYGSSQCLITPSGMAAISCALNGLLNYFSGKDLVNIFYSHELFSATPGLIKSIKESAYMINVLDSASVIQLFTAKGRNQFNILFLESCTNPHGFIFDFSLIPELRKLSKQLFVIVDNTWLSCASFNPLIFGADIVVTSLTKYYSGGNAIGGAVLKNAEYVSSNNNYFDKIIRYSTQNGFHVSPVNAQIILNNITDVETRIAKTSAITKSLIETYSDKIEIIHPLLNSHPSNELAKKYLKYWPSVFVIKVNTSKNKAIGLMSQNSQIEYKTSFGGKDNRFDTYPKIIDGIVHCRFAVGYNDDKDIIKGFDEFVKKLSIQPPNPINENQTNQTKSKKHTKT